MMKDLISLEDVLFVFGAWTLMFQTSKCPDLVSGVQVDLFDENQKKIGIAHLCKLLRSRNSEITPIEIEVLSLEQGQDMKKVKFVKLVS